MSKQTRQSKYLEEINNIGKEFSGTDEDELSESKDILFGNDNDLLDSESESTDTNDEEENIVNKRGGRKRMRLLSSSEEENEKNDQRISI